uniref:Uncharacterized protein n=1 Tax=Heliothis virescens TaxID=7102 RepID=A0A2A4JXN5_HELVI
MATYQSEQKDSIKRTRAISIEGLLAATLLSDDMDFSKKAVHGLQAVTRVGTRPPLVSRPSNTEARDIPLRAQSVCLAERPRSKYARAVRSADLNRARFSDKQTIQRSASTTNIKRRQNNVVVKQQNRKVVEKVPFAVSVQTLSIPMKYADEPKPRHSTSKPPQNVYNRGLDVNKTKRCNPPKQVGDNKRLCDTASCGKGTENKLLLQISEAEQVTDFERILNSNAILCERVRGHVWHGCVAPQKRSASVLPRPKSAYSLYAVSQTYHYLFRQHEESLESLIEQYRQSVTEDKKPSTSILERNWFENLQNLSEYYEDDQELQEEVENITDRIVTEEVKAVEEHHQASKRNKNFNVNLADLISLNINGERLSPSREDHGPSPDVEKTEAENEEEWLAPSMSANSDDRDPQNDTNVDCLAQNLDSVKIDSDAKVPTITFSNCCDGYARSDLPNNKDVDIHLAVPAIDSIDEARPPMM